MQKEGLQLRRQVKEIPGTCPSRRLCSQAQVRRLQTRLLWAVTQNPRYTCMYEKRSDRRAGSLGQN